VCSLSGATATTVSATITAGSGSCSVTATRAADANYLVASGATSITATKRALAVNANAATKVYGSAEPTLTATLTGFAFSDGLATSGITGAAGCSRVLGYIVATYSITCTPDSLGAANYSFATGATAVFSITQKSLTITASNATITYRDATPAIGPLYSGLTNGDAAPATAPTCSTLVGSTTAVGTYASTCTGAVDGNYALAYVAGTVTVLISNQTITFAQPATPATYASTFDVAPSSTSDLAVTVNASGGCSIAGATVTMTSGTTGCTLTASQAGDASFTAATDVVRTVAAAKATQAPVAEVAPSIGTYGSSHTVSAFGGSGTGAYSFSQTGPCTLSGATTSTVSATITAGSGTCSVTATRAADPNYLVASAITYITATKKALAVNASIATKVYGSTDPTFGATFTGYAFSDALPTSGVTGSPACSRTLGSSVASYSITCTPGTLAAANYSFATGSSAAFTITVKALTITASSATITYRDPAPAIAPLYSGLTNGDTAPATVPSCSTLVDSTTTVGTYDSTCVGAVDGNYALAYVAGTVTVLISGQAITFVQPASPATFASSFTVAPTSTSGLAVTISASGGCSVAGFDVTMTSGTTNCTLVASQAGSGNFTAATPVSRVVGATKALQAALDLAAPANATYGDTFDVTATGGSGAGADSFSLEPGSVCTIASITGSVASVTLTAGVGTCDIVVTKATDADYLAASTSTSITAGRAPLDVDAVDAAKTYGDADPAFTIALTGLIAGDDGSVASGSADCTRTTGEDVDSYTITCAPGSLTAANYSFATGATASLVIDPRDLTITASSATTHFGDAAPAITPAFDDLAGGDTTTAIAPACATIVDASTPTGSYPSTCSGAVDANYTISYVDGTVVVAAAAQTITFVQPGAAAFGASFSVDPVASSSLGVVVTASGGCTVVATTTWQVTMTSGTDSCELTASQAGDANFVATQLTVHVAALKAAQSALTASGPDSAIYGELFSVVATGGSGTGTVEFSASGPCSADDVSFLMTAGTGSCVIVATRSGDANYSATDSTATVNAELATLFIDAVDAEKTLGDDDPDFTWTVRGFVADDSAETVQVSGAAECARETGDTAGAFEITCEPGTLSAANYGFETGKPGVLTVAEAVAETTDGAGSGGGSADPSGGSAATTALIIGGGVVFVGSAGAAVYFIRRRVLF
jgi:hypothetical protein